MGKLLCPVQMVRFSQSFDEDDAGEDDMRRLSSKPPLAPSGGSVSLAAQHFCPVCGIIATSQDNLEVRACCLPSPMPSHSHSPVPAALCLHRRAEQLGERQEHGLGPAVELHIIT